MKDDHAARGDGAGEGSASTQHSWERRHGPAEVAPRPATHYELRPPRRRGLLQALIGATPGIEVLRHYRKGWLRSDVYAGISVVAYLVPQVMAYTALVGVPPVVGLWTALVALLVYAAMGSSRVLSVGPESTIALMAGTAIAPLAGADPEQAVALGAALSLIVGGLVPDRPVLRLGVIADLLSQPLLVGYLAGAAVLMVVGQLGKMTGTTVEGDNLVARAAVLCRGRRRHAPPDPRGRRGHAGPAARDPLPAAALAGDADRRRGGHRRLCAGRPERPRGRGRGRRADRAADARPPRRDVGGVRTPAARRTRDRGDRLQRQHADRPRPSPRRPTKASRPSEAVDPQQELLALGGVHVAAGLMSGFPVSSSGSRTALAISAHARTQLYSLVAAAFVVLVLFVAGPLIENLPQAALAAVVFYAASKLVSWQEIVRLARFRTTELLLAVTAALGTAPVRRPRGRRRGDRTQPGRDPVSAGSPPRRRSRPRAGAGRDARRGRLPRCRDPAGAGRLPLRRPAVLRQRR